MMMKKARSNYLFHSRVLTHVLFWVVYYLTFSLLWARDGQLHQSFSLEFILMPIRIGASYLTIYLLMPRYLLTRQLLKFFGALSLLLVVSGLLQRVFTFFFYELFFESEAGDLWDVLLVVRAMVLINSTVLLLSAVKMYDYWQKEHELNTRNSEEYLTIRSEKRNYRVKPSEIQYAEGLGNYVTLYLESKKPMISYLTLKELESMLPEQFLRVHKSFIINKTHVESYTNENVEIANRMIPLGKTVQMEL